jgi:hypothetical protein
MADDSVWKQRFYIFLAARVGGLAMMLLGIVIAWSDVVREGGWPVLGAIVALMGAIDTIFAPKLLKAHWAREDAERGNRR